MGYGNVGFGNTRFAIDVDHAAHVDYCHINPVQHGYVHRVSEWPHSTFHRYVERGVYPLNWATGPDIDWTVGERP